MTDSSHKTFFFMGGLPRSGGTLLSAILNQNPLIHAGAQTDLIDLLSVFHFNAPQLESYQAKVREQGFENAKTQLAYNFYADIEKPIIIERNRGWNGVNGIHIAKALTETPKMIIPVRNILDILASFVTLTHKYPETNYIDQDISRIEFPTKYYRPIDDARCDYLMRSGGALDYEILNLHNLTKPEYNGIFHIVKYNDLITNPEETITSIYKFLEIESYSHDLSNITKSYQEDEMATTGIPSMHQIRNTIDKSKTDYTKILSSYAINKYSNALGFLNLGHL
jgi:sulfotransferase